MRRTTAKRWSAIAIATLVAGCGGIVDVVNEYGDDARDAGSEGGAIDGSAIDASVTTDGGTIEWGAESGTRLKAIWWKTDDGARKFAGWHDDELGQDCTFIHTIDGVDRCVPPAPYIQGYGSPTLFEDAACTVPIVFANRPTAESSCALTNPTPGGLYATLIYSAPTGGGSCGFAFEVHSLSPTSGLAHVYGGAGCVEKDTDPTLSYYEFGAAIPPSIFVGSKIATEPASTRLTFLTRTMDDGARERLNFYDTKLGVSCGAGRSADGVERCLPDTTGDVAVFGDSTCTTPLEHCDHSTSCDEDECGNAVPFAALTEQTNECDARLHIFPVTGAVSDGTQVYDLAGETCSPFYVVENQPTGYVGAELSASTFAPLTSRFVESSSRLERYEWDPGEDGPRGIVTATGGSGHPYDDFGWRDGARGEDCAFTATADDQLRCVPPAAFVQTFSDSNCSAGLVTASSTAGCSGVARYMYERPTFLDACGRERVFQLGGEEPDASTFHLLAEDDGGLSCAGFTPPPSTTFVAAGTDVTSQFAVFSRVIE